jgi:hypothetical protein
MNTDEQVTAPVQTSETRICSNLNCTFGGTPQPLDKAHFTLDARYTGGYRTECRRCESERAKEYNRQHREQATAARRRWVEKNREHVNTYQKKRYRRMADAYQQQKQQTA